MKPFLAALTLAVLAACGTPAKISYYTLTVAQGPAAAAPAARAVSVYVGPVTLPDEVDRPQMVIRIAPNQVDVADLDRWAEPLKVAIPRLVADTLARELGTTSVMTSRQSATLTFDYRVVLDIQRFDFSAGDGAAVDALWTIRAEKDAGAGPRTGRSEARERSGGTGPEAMAAAQSRAVEKIAADVAQAIRDLDLRGSPDRR